MSEAVGQDALQTLDARLQEYHDVDIKQVLDVIAYVRDAGDTVLVGGSLAYGLGNRGSDLDVVVAGPDTIESSSRMPLEHWVGSLRIDVWKLMRREIDDLFVRAESGLNSDAPFAGAFGDVFEQADLKLLHRLAYGFAIDGPELIPTTTGDYREIARDLLVREYAERMRESAYVAQLAAESGSHFAATTNARAAVEDALNAVLAARGLAFSDNKWLQVRLEGDAPDLRALYEPFACLTTAEGSAAFVRDAVELAHQLTGVALSIGDLASAALWERGDLQMIKLGERRLLLSQEKGALWELNAEEASGWEHFEDRSRWSSEQCDQRQLTLCFQLYAAGILLLRWSKGLPVSLLDVSAEVC